MNSALALTGISSDWKLSITAEALQQKVDALSLASTVTVVTDYKLQQDAIAAASLCKALIKRCEVSRKCIKEIPWKICCDIEADSNGYKKELLTEQIRLEDAAAGFQREEDRKAKAILDEEERRQREQREAEEAERRKEQEALAKIALEAEQERRAALAKIQAAKDDEARELAQIEADSLAAARSEEQRINQEACREAEEKRMDAARERMAKIQAIAQSKPEGATVKRAMDYELKDIRALYLSRPDLVELLPRRAEILAAISIPGAPSIPGIYVFENTKIHSKAAV